MEQTSESGLLARPFLDVFHDVADGLQFLGVLIRNFHRKFLFKSHYQLDDIEGVRAQVFDERGGWV